MYGGNIPIYTFIPGVLLCINSGFLSMVRKLKCVNKEAIMTPRSLNNSRPYSLCIRLHNIGAIVAHCFFFKWHNTLFLYPLKHQKKTFSPSNLFTPSFPNIEGYISGKKEKSLYILLKNDYPLQK